MGKIKIGLIILGSMALVGLVVGLASRSEMKLEFKDEPGNSEISGASGFGLPNPSAVYCKELGYGYEIKNTKEGQIGVCIFPDGSSAKAWEFYSGESKREFSYCTAKGYELKTKKNCAWSSECSVCVLPDGEEIPVFILMLKEKPKKDYLKKFYEAIEEGQSQKSPLENGSSSGELSQISSVGLPTSFDWRNNNGDWLTPVKDQGNCGSCWAFASVGAHESQIDIKSNDPTIDKDLAEQYLVSNCFPPANCNGLYLSDIANLFNFHRDNGIVDEGCFPYQAKNSSCTPCSDYQARLWKIENWYTVASTTDDIKGTLINEGPLWVGIYMSSSFDANNIMRCNSSQDSNVNHAVVIVGYNDDGQYWIVRNSWGANWGPEKNGYFKVGYGECNIDSYVSGYKDIVALKGIGIPVGPDTTPPTISINKPANGSVTNSQVVSFTVKDNVDVDEATIVVTINGVTSTVFSPATHCTAGTTQVSCSYTETGIIEGSNTLTVDAKDMAGNAATQASTAFAYDITPPAKVTGFTVTVVSDSQLDLSWNASTATDSDHYNVYRSTTSGGPYNLIASPITNSYSDTGLTASTTYYYVVSAVDKAGNEGVKSDEASGTTKEKAAVKCWSAGYQYLYLNNGQAKKFCKCAQGSYGYKSYSSKRLKATVYKYVDTGDNENWAVTSQNSYSPIYSVTCTDGAAYSTNQDYYYPK